LCELHEPGSPTGKKYQSELARVCAENERLKQQVERLEQKIKQLKRQINSFFDTVKENDQLILMIRDMIAAAGNPDAADGCRVVINIGREALGKES
jgi:predicted nuclease with TOPRIM domain